MSVIAVYLIVVNVVAFVLYGYDKCCARNNSWRVPESVLLTFAFFGGSVGALVGMRLFHHKTKKLKFNILVPLALILQVILCVLVKDCLVG
ncbi:MAG: DUF1294 domain-containing protein [Paludibacteraceae bacterium]|nr:DUF1294 domain-containing protein [Paludibacteraceae bacterium]